ncbi:MAG: YdcF family protein [Alphaproteobacteria bacterium]|nr:MAG: YdcF family protein [Alphaproteobacteria bacterium]
MYTLAATIVWGILQPSNLIALLGMFALGLALVGARQLAARTGALALILLVLIGLLPVGQLLIRPLEERFAPPAMATLGPVTGIIVLGGAESPGLTGARDTVHLRDTGNRLTTALALAQRYPRATLLFTGGYRSGGLSQAEVAGRLFMEAGVDPHRLILEDQSHNTWENAHLSKALARPQPDETWLLVTSAFHMPRSMAVFEAADWTVIPYPTDYRSLPNGLDWTLDVATRLREADLALHEWVGLVVYRLIGRTREFFPAPDGGATT